MDNGSITRFGCYLRTHWCNPRRIRFWLLLLVIVYTVLGFLGLPWLVQHLAVEAAREDYGRDLRIERVRTNPFTLTLRIDELALDDTDQRPLLGWQQLFVDLKWSSIVNRAWTLKSIRLDGPVIQEERFASGETRLSRLFSRPDDQAPKGDDPASRPSLWVENLQVQGGALRFVDNLSDGNMPDDEESHRVTLALQDIEISVKELSLQDGARFPASLDGRFAGGGELVIDGTLGFLPSFALEGEGRVDGLALAQIEPYLLRRFTDVRLNSGVLALSGQMRTDEQEPFAFLGAVDIDALRIDDGSEDELLIGWDSVRTGRLDLSVTDRRLETDPIAADGLSGRVVIHEDRTTNFGRLMAKDTPSRAEGEGPVRSEEESAPFGVIVESIGLTDGSLEFTDHSLPLPFATSIRALGGEISTLSSSSAQPAKVELEGQVEDYGLARISGTVHAWHPLSETDLALNFRNLEIPEYSPYTVQFAGRKIAGGTMDLDLTYKVTDRQLDGSNNLILRDPKLGEKMESSDAMDLPLELAIALLKDSDDVIELDLPVSGDVGDPEFDFGQVIREALSQAFTSVVEAPFRFLASLVGADSEAEDLGRIDFPAGRADLTPPQRERIANLRQALNQRQALILELAGPFSPNLDGPSLQREKAVEALRQRLDEAGRDVTDPGLTAESNQEAILAMFTSHYPDTDLETVRERFTEAQDESSEEAEFDALAYRNHLAEQVIAAQPVTATDLETLARARAEAVRDALVEEGAEDGVATDRVRFLEPVEVDSQAGEGITMEIGVGTEV